MKVNFLEFNEFVFSNNDFRNHVTYTKILPILPHDSFYLELYE